MKTLKKIMSALLALAVAIAGLAFTPSVAKAKDTLDSSEWKSVAIISPSEGELIGAGYIDVKFSNELDNASKYTLYVDSKAVKTVNATSDKVMACEFYTTSVAKHTAYVVAEQKDGNVVTSDTRTFFVTKKGICVNSKDMGTKVDPKDMNIGWYYDWGRTRLEEDSSKITKFIGLDFVPMFWSDPMKDYKIEFDTLKEKGYKYVLGFNEPDLKWESNKTPDIAKLRLMNFFIPNKGNMRLGSPATATFPSWSDTWWKPYWSMIGDAGRNATDFIAIHSYFKFYDGPQTALKYLEAIDECYELYRKPIWITEVALWKFNKNDAEGCRKTEEFLAILMKGLNERSYVERFSWFSPTYNPAPGAEDASAAALFEYETGKLTNRGKVYANIGNPAGYNAKTYSEAMSSVSVDTSVKSTIGSNNTNLATIKGKKKAFNYEVKTIPNVKGFQFQYSTSSNMANPQTVDVSVSSTSEKYITGNAPIVVSSAVNKVINKANKKIKKYNKKVKKYNKKIKKYNKKHKKKKKLKKTKKLVKTQKYYIRVRGMKTFLGTKYYAAWSGIDSTKITVK